MKSQISNVLLVGPRITRITLPYFVTFSLTSETLLLLIPEYSQNYKADKSSENGKHHEMMTSWQSFE